MKRILLAAAFMLAAFPAFGQSSGFNPTYPPRAAAVTNSATGTTAATAATLPAAVGQTTYICGFAASAQATAGIAGTVVVTGTISGSLNYQLAGGTTPAVGTLVVPFSPCVPASAQNTTIVVTMSAAGAGGITSVTATGYQFPNP